MLFNQTSRPPLSGFDWKICDVEECDVWCDIATIKNLYLNLDYYIPWRRDVYDIINILWLLTTYTLDNFHRVVVGKSTELLRFRSVVGIETFDCINIINRIFDILSIVQCRLTIDRLLIVFQWVTLHCTYLHFHC